jgi:uncharacterized membrane protein
MDGQTNSEQLDAAEILEEAKRRQRASRQPENEALQSIVILLDRFVFWLSRHWLAVFNALAFLYAGLPILAPILMRLGVEGPASFIYAIYKPLCHQLPQRSWFLFGSKFSYRLPELMELAGEAVDGPWAGEFIGNPNLGYKVAFCQRDTAIYGTIFLAGLVFGLLRSRGREVKPLPWWAYIGIGILPMGIDGGYQLLSYILPLVFPNVPIPPHETTPLARTVTGAMFGGATVWLAYPYVQQSMDDIRETLQRRFGWT